MLVIIFIVFGFCFLLERIKPGWKLPNVSTWTIRVLGVNFIQLSIVVLAGFTWEKWFSSVSVFKLSQFVP
ncbi:MAG: sterol desaturase family protein, partial [Pedobacter sp.]